MKPAEYLRTTLLAFIDRLPHQDKRALKEFLHCSAYSFGTVCAGSEAPALVLNELVDALEKRLAVHMKCQHRFSSEIAEDKRNFIESIFPDIPCMFGAVETLEFEKSISYHDKGRRMLPKSVPSVDWAFAGFPCKDVSTLNSNKKKFKSVIAEGGSKTGSCFQSILRWVRAHGGALNIIWFENVVGLHVQKKKGSKEPTNLEVCLDELSGLGFYAFAVQVDPRCYGTPQSRARLWIPCIKLVYLTSLGWEPAAFRSKVCKLMEKFSGIPIMPIEHILLDEDDALVKAYLRATKQKGDGAQDSNWPELHKEIFDRAGKECPAEISSISEDIKILYPSTRDILLREEGCLAFAGVEFPEKTRRLINVAPSIDRIQVSTEHFLCTTPRQRVWVSDRCRFLLGYESLATQGIHYGDRDNIVRATGDKLLGDLSGNAFHTGSCGAAVVATLVVLASGPKAASNRGSSSSSGLTLLASSAMDSAGDIEAAGDGCEDLDTIWNM